MKLPDIQQTLKAPKTQYNSFGKYYYRNAEDILEAVKPLLGDSILTLSDEVVQVGNRNYVKATAELVEYESDERTRLRVAVVTAYACEAEDRKGMDASQITGAASSYARKYALNGLFLIDDTKDADHDEPKATEKQADKPAARPLTPIEKQKKQIADLMKAIGCPITKENAMDEVKRVTGYELIEEAYPDIIRTLEALRDEKNSK